MSKFTPGEWEFGVSVPTWITCGNLHIATVAKAFDGDFSPANGCLLAASPDLYAACKAIATLPTSAAQHNGVLVPLETIAALCAALAKADGAERGE